MWSQQAYLKASNSDELDLFGASVAISGDLVVGGAPEESSNAASVQHALRSVDTAPGGRPPMPTLARIQETAP